MLTDMLLGRSARYLVVTVLAAGLVASTTDGFAQPPPRGPHGGDRPVQRTLPRKEIYRNLSEAIDVKEAEAKSLAQSVEDRGFPLRETIVVLLLAKARADHLLDEGKFAKEQRTQAIRGGADFLVGLVDKDKAGWLDLVQKSGAKVDLSAVVTKANEIIGFYSERAGVSSTVPATAKPVTKE